MIEKSSLEKYIAYLQILQTRLDVYFDEQKEFIKCKAGCDLCCKNSYYPTSQLEYEYVKLGLSKNFTSKEREQISQSVLEIFIERKLFAKANPNLLDFSYKCPLLVDGKCGIYDYRPLLCRAHGLIYHDIDNPNKENIPHCMTLGLNYSDVFDSDRSEFSEERALAFGIKARPKAYNLSYTPLMQDSGDIDFGDIRMLFEWILMDIDNFQELIKE